MPGVSPDGKKVMKLIPGVLVNGKFVQTPGIKLQTGVAPQKLLPINRSPGQTAKKMTLDPPLTQQVINKVSLLNTVPSQVGVNVNNVPNKQPAQQKYFLVKKPLGALEAAVPAVPVVMKAPALPGGQNMKSQNPKYFILRKPSVSTATVTAANEKPRFPSQLPVTVKSGALPGGIPPNTVVRTVPVSELPPGIKKQSFTALPSSPSGSGSGSDPGSGLPGVVNVTPITTARERATPPAPKVPPEPSYKYFPGIQGATKQLKLVQKAPQGPNGPCKWVIEEVDTAAPEDPPPVTPKAPSAPAGKTEAGKHAGVAPRPDPDPGTSRSGSGRSDPVVVCNGKVFVMAKKSKNASVTHELSKPQSERREKGSSGGTPDRFEEVIDLCEDDDHNVLTIASQDEDNVIFVSYMPPRPKAPDLQLAERRRRPDGCAAGSDLPDPRGSSPDRRGDSDLCGSAEVVGSRSPEALNPGKPSRREEVVVEEMVVEEAVEEMVVEEALEEKVVEKAAVEEEVELVVAAAAEEHTAGGTEVRQ